jgi:hypothetical protein
MTTYKTISQIEFDKSTQRITSLGLSRASAENIVLSFWKIAQDLDLDFKKFLDASIVNGQLDVDQRVLDYINKTLPSTIRYRKDALNKASTLVLREL